MKQIKIAFFDVDGTLIDMNKKVISANMLETLIRLKQNHIKLCVSTGRPPQNVPRFPEVEFDAFITFNASYCYTKEKCLLKNPIPAADVRTIIENANRIGRPVSLASAARMGANGRDPDLVEYFSFSNQPVDVVKDFDELAKEDIYQIMMGCRQEEYEQVLHHVKGAKITAWWSRAVDIIPANGGKGLGVERILAHYHLDREEAIAFGDGRNDMDMLQAAGTGVAMGNATDDVKRMADAVCGSVAEDGIYNYCKEHHLI